MSFSYYAKRLIFVHKCTACRRILNEKEFDEALCSACRKQYDRVKTENCPDCFKEACECVCQPSLLKNSGSLCLRKLYFYSGERQDGAQNKLIYYIKHHRSKRTFEFLAGELFSMVKEEADALGLDIQKDIIFQNVPRGRSAFYKDGFDQAEELCIAMSRLFGVQRGRLLKRKAGGKEQKKLNARERQKNMESLIVFKKGKAEELSGKYVVLVDDVVTTGAGMSACARVLRRNGARGIISAAVAMNLRNKKQ